METLVVNQSNERLDKYISANTDYSRSLVSKLIENNYILVNDKSEKASYKVRENDEIKILDGFIEETEIEPVKMDLDIVYEDNDIMVINKPSGLTVHPGSGNKNNTLVNGLLEYTNNLSDVNGDERPGIVHRLDKDTSGLMLVAKTNKAHEILSTYFEKHEVKRKYWALIKGVFPHNTAIIDAPIGRDENDRKKMTVTAKNSKKAITHLKVLKRFQNYTLVELELETGRTHQIRVHLSYIGYPIYNDPVYNNKNATEFGQFLHSKTIDFVHPITKEQMHFEIDLPEEFQKFLDELE
ncbi:MAG: RluA family pseudouridine synthase [Firmicutes bacterium]|nr:RluA family pseudouridine synthase [Bacillota bacterium]